MTRLNMTVEGPTEQQFAVQLLRGHLAGYNVFMDKPRLTAHAKKHGKPHRGGMRTYGPFRNDIARWLKQDRGKDVFFTTMIDLYGLPTDFPGYEEAAKIIDPYQRVAMLEEAFAKDEEIRNAGGARFIPYIQLHEFEALLLSDPGEFSGRYVRSPELQKVQRVANRNGINNLKELCAAFDSPERIDDGRQTAPSKRIGREIPMYVREKRTAGPIIAQRIGLKTMRQKCPHFDQWLRNLESLGAPPASTST